MDFTFSLGADSARKHIIDASGIRNFEIGHYWHLLPASIELMVIGYGNFLVTLCIEQASDKKSQNHGMT